MNTGAVSSRQNSAGAYINPTAGVTGCIRPKKDQARLNPSLCQKGKLEVQTPNQVVIGSCWEESQFPLGSVAMDETNLSSIPSNVMMEAEN